MADQYTVNYRLCQWAPEDAFNRVEFNADNAKVDTALRGLETSKAKQSELSALQTTVGKKADKTTVTALENQMNTSIDRRGYTAAGAYDGDSRSSRYIDVGFPVAGVLVERRDGNRSITNGTWGAIAVLGSPGGPTGQTVIQVAGHGFYVYHNTAPGAASLNNVGMTFHYLALG